MAVETVLISRSVTFDPAIQREVSKDLERFASMGFSVYRQVGDMVTIPEAAAAREVPATAVVVPDSRQRLHEVADAIRDIREKHRLSYHGIGALVGCSDGTIGNLARGDNPSVSVDLHDRIMSLLKKSQRISKGSSQLRDLAKGASSGVRNLAKSGTVRVRRRRGPNLTDDKKLEIASLRETGKTFSEVASLAGVSPRTVRRVCKELAE